MKYISNCEKDTYEIGKKLAENLNPGDVIAFYGDLGAGKTAFTKGVCAHFGIEDVHSPTFTIVNEYKSAKGFPIYHFDFYRINKLDEAYDIGIDEYFNGHGLCLIEWPEKITPLLPDDCINVTISVKEDLQRSIEIS
jgi:tRNA threonylcarbamoyladenosine biosynthesis protein TsaE